MNRELAMKLILEYLSEQKVGDEYFCDMTRTKRGTGIGKAAFDVALAILVTSGKVRVVRKGIKCILYLE